MYIEKSRYKSSTRVRIVRKVILDGVWRKQIVCHIGSAQHEIDLAVLLSRANNKLAELRQGDQLSLDLKDTSSSLPSSSLQSRSKLERTGEYWQLAEMVLGSLYDRLGLSDAKSDAKSTDIVKSANDLLFFKLMVMSRVIFPASKLRTAKFLSDCMGVPCYVNQLYRIMDNIAKHQVSIISSVRRYIVEKYPTALGYVLYDVTTLYFELEYDDEDVTLDSGDVIPGLRKKGYSKDRRGDLPQIVLGLAVNELGMPLSYQVHSGDTYEGHTLISGIEATLDVLSETRLTVVADAGMLSEKNLKALEDKKLHYIVGARLKNLSSADQSKILKLKFRKVEDEVDADTNTNINIHELQINKRRMIITYSDARAARAKSLRDKSVARLERLIAKGTAVKKHGYLSFTVKDTPEINQAAVDAAEQWDGIKGYVTNRDSTEMSAVEVIEHYTNLFKVEQSFRLYKSDVVVRPAFHYRRERIEAHVLICMLALTLMRILEQEVKPLGLTIDKALQEICSAKAAIVSLNGQSFTIPPAYTGMQAKILGITTA